MSDYSASLSSTETARASKVVLEGVVVIGYHILVSRLADHGRLTRSKTLSTLLVHMVQRIGLTTDQDHRKASKAHGNAGSHGVARRSLCSENLADNDTGRVADTECNAESCRTLVVSCEVAVKPDNG